jgi:NADP-dependent 3-hydroxy acid dehydrogenase YdfG
VFPASTRIAVAGRSTAKLQALVATLDARDRLAVLGQVDVSDEASLEGMVRGTR